MAAPRPEDSAALTPLEGWEGVVGHQINQGAAPGERLCCHEAQLWVALFTSSGAGVLGGQVARVYREDHHYPGSGRAGSGGRALPILMSSHPTPMKVLEGWAVLDSHVSPSSCLRLGAAVTDVALVDEPQLPHPSSPPPGVIKVTLVRCVCQSCKNEF